MSIQTVDRLYDQKPFKFSCQTMYNLKTWKIIGYAIRVNTPFSRLAERTASLQKRDIHQDLEILRSTIMAFTRNFPPHHRMKLLIKLNSSTLLHTSFMPLIKELLKLQPFQNYQIVLEIHLYHESSTIHLLKNRVSQLKDLGSLVSLQVSSLDISPYRCLIDLEPYWIYLSPYFSSGLSRSRKKQKIVHSYVESLGNKAAIGLEGIEKPEDLAMAKVLGVQLGQGSVFDKGLSMM